MSVVGDKDGFLFDDGGFGDWTEEVIARASTIHNLRIVGGVQKGIKYPNSRRGNTAMIATILEKKDQWLSRYLEQDEEFQAFLETVQATVWSSTEEMRRAVRRELKKRTREIRKWLEAQGHVKSGTLRKATRWKAVGLKKVR